MLKETLHALTLLKPSVFSWLELLIKVMNRIPFFFVCAIFFPAACNLFCSSSDYEWRWKIFQKKKKWTFDFSNMFSVFFHPFSSYESFHEWNCTIIIHSTILQAERIHTLTRSGVDDDWIWKCNLSIVTFNLSQKPFLQPCWRECYALKRQPCQMEREKEREWKRDDDEK